jgi:hypothetical protein
MTVPSRTPPGWVCVLARRDQSPERKVVDDKGEKYDEKNDAKDRPEPNSACRARIVCGYGARVCPVRVCCFRG